MPKARVKRGAGNPKAQSDEKSSPITLSDKIGGRKSSTSVHGMSTEDLLKEYRSPKLKKDKHKVEKMLRRRGRHKVEKMLRRDGIDPTQETDEG